MHLSSVRSRIDSLMLRAGRLFGLLAALRLFAGCSAASGVLPPTPRKSLTDVFRGFARAQCAFFERCNAPRLMSDGEDEGQCFERRFAELQSEIRSYEAMIDAHRTEFREESVSACIKLIETTDCLLVGPAPYCSRFGVGAQAVGAPCLYSDECKADLYCPSDGWTCSTCQKGLLAGSQCDVLGSTVCGEGLACSDGICRAPIAHEGDPCHLGRMGTVDTSTLACAGRLQCAFHGSTPICKRPGVEGDSCDFLNECDSWQGYECASDQRCERVIWGPVGSRCDEFGERCSVSAGCVAGVCEKLPSAGAQCEPNLGCDKASFCDTGHVCTLRRGLGEQCEQTGQCLDDLLCRRQPGETGGECADFMWHLCQ
jgi:hypothetical protein